MAQPAVAVHLRTAENGALPAAVACTEDLVVHRRILHGAFEVYEARLKGTPPNDGQAMARSHAGRIFDTVETWRARCTPVL